MVFEKKSSSYVVKRNGRHDDVHFDKITARIRKLCYNLNMDFVEPVDVAIKVISGIYKGVTTVELDNLAAVVKKHSQLFLSKIVYDRDFNYIYFGFKTLERSYLLKINGQVVERPQHMLMRVAIGIHGEDLESVIETYDLKSERWFTHASQTLFNAGTCRPQMSSCFLLTMVEDSIEGICQALDRCALISKSAGGIGVNVHKICAFGSYIAGTNGTSNGLVPMLRVFNSLARYVDQGGNMRPGAFAIYLEPWHADIMEFLELKKNTGVEEERAHDLFYGLWIPELFMERVESDNVWSLMCPHECPGLDDCYGEEFVKLFTKYEAEGRQLKARDVWKAIISLQIETGTPYMLYKDACNAKSNQKNLGTIKCSNLCTEIIEYSSPDEVAFCKLALNRYVKEDKNYKSLFINFQKLKEVTKTVAKNLNVIIDKNYYPVLEAEYSNKRHRPIGIGVQGLADVFQLLRVLFVSPEVKLLNKQIFETIYYSALEASCELAEKYGPYETYQGSPVSQGILQYDMWRVTPTPLWDCAALKAKIANHGIRNSLLTSPMPTTSTAQILGYNESIEVYTSNIYRQYGTTLYCEQLTLTDDDGNNGRRAIVVVADIKGVIVSESAVIHDLRGYRSFITMDFRRKNTEAKGRIANSRVLPGIPALRRDYQRKKVHKIFNFGEEVGVYAVAGVDSFEDQHFQKKKIVLPAEIGRVVFCRDASTYRFALLAVKNLARIFLLHACCKDLCDCRWRTRRYHIVEVTEQWFSIGRGAPALYNEYNEQEMWRGTTRQELQARLIATYSHASAYDETATSAAFYGFGFFVGSDDGTWEITHG